MKNSILAVLLSPLLFAATASADISKEAGALHKSLAGTFLKAAPQSAPVKLAVLNFDETSADAQKSKAGRVVSAALIQQFSADPAFRVIERERLDAIFKELRFSLSGVVEPKEVKRAGIILGTDYLVLGSVSESDGKFLVQGRWVNVETGLVAAAASVSVEKILLLKEAEEFNSARLGTAFAAFIGSTKIVDLKLTGTHIGAELRHNFTKRQFGAVQLFKLTGANDEVYKSQHFRTSLGTGNDRVNETFTSLFAMSVSYGLMQRLPLRTRLTVQAGPALYIMDADQKFFDEGATGIFMGNTLPTATSTTYYASGFQAAAGLERNLAKTLIAGITFSYHSFSFKRKLDPGASAPSLAAPMAQFNKKVSCTGASFGVKLAFSF